MTVIRRLTLTETWYIFSPCERKVDTDFRYECNLQFKQFTTAKSFGLLSFTANCKRQKLIPVIFCHIIIQITKQQNDSTLKFHFTTLRKYIYMQLEDINSVSWTDLQNTYWLYKSVSKHSWNYHIPHEIVMRVGGLCIIKIWKRPWSYTTGFATVPFSFQ